MYNTDASLKYFIVQVLASATLLFTAVIKTLMEDLFTFERNLLLLLQWRYSPGWAWASFTIRLQASRSLALSLRSFIPIFLRSVDTSSSHLIFGLPLRLVAYSFMYNIFFGIAVFERNLYTPIIIYTALLLQIGAAPLH